MDVPLLRLVVWNRFATHLVSIVETKSNSSSSRRRIEQLLCPHVGGKLAAIDDAGRWPTDRLDPTSIAQSTLSLVRCDQGRTAFLAIVCFAKIPGGHEFDFLLVVSTFKNEICGTQAEGTHV